MNSLSCPKCGEVTEIFLSGAGKKAAERFDVPLLGSLPLDPSVPPGGDSGNPIVIESPDSSTGKAFTELAGTACERLDAMQTRPSGFKLSWNSGV